MLFTKGPKCEQETTPFALNFGKHLLVLSKIKKRSCLVVPDVGVFLLQEATSDSGSSLLTEGAWAVGITHSIFKNSFFAIIF